MNFINGKEKNNMENYTKRINDLKAEISILEEKRINFREALSNLKIGDIVYTCSGEDYYLQTVKEIDIENCELTVYEEGIKKLSTIIYFYLIENEQFVYYS